MATEIMIFETKDNEIKLTVPVENETVWLTQAQMTELFQVDRTVITRHVNNVFKENELIRESNVQKMHIPNSDRHPSLEEKAANLLYFMIKDHPYADGCKRIAASLFLEFLVRNNVLYEKGQKRISDGALVAITLMIAESDPKEKDIMVNLVMNLLTM